MSDEFNLFFVGIQTILQIVTSLQTNDLRDDLENRFTSNYWGWNGKFIFIIYL